MASRDSESNPDSSQAIDVASVSIENESEMEQGRCRRKPRKMKEWGSVSSKVKRNLGARALFSGGGSSCGQLCGRGVNGERVSQHEPFLSLGWTGWCARPVL
ncbi:hypothetical protein Pmani_021184 [Petrolisthes manimaculis]|uniref:Uncharacterized protein n=1 Tax=Petrolisthes manimaculis TaxID=1843537 RepID=A0AAE1U2C9_9EUCA|nr:hypothetical protein Pmani_021184 [Petrolisthes manimaculis]